MPFSGYLTHNLYVHTFNSVYLSPLSHFMPHTFCLVQCFHVAVFFTVMSSADLSANHLYIAILQVYCACACCHYEHPVVKHCKECRPPIQILCRFSVNLLMHPWTIFQGHFLFFVQGMISTSWKFSLSPSSCNSGTLLCSGAAPLLGDHSCYPSRVIGF